ncbi:MAG: hypothetical protein PHR20_09205, partial [Bacteroidales bacterium]|nr:hypothetical protein [Bacteroidales bacterium]
EAATASGQHGKHQDHHNKPSRFHSLFLSFSVLRKTQRSQYSTEPFFRSMVFSCYEMTGVYCYSLYCLLYQLIAGITT